MKKYLPYILALLIAAAVIILLVTGTNNKNDRRLDERVTLRKQDKIPYGTYVAYQTLKNLFPRASVYIDRHEPGYWDSLSTYDSGQAFIAITHRFNPYEDEMRRLISFAENGNDVFISTMTISYEAKKMMNCTAEDYRMPSYFGDDLASADDTMNITLSNPPFSKELKYSYPGKPYGSIFTKTDSTTTNVLGEVGGGWANFIHLRAGKGNIYVHLSPLAFSNYFLLHKNNITYYEKVMSVIKPGVSKVLWDEYFRNKGYENGNNGKEKSWLSVLFQYPAMRAALLTAIFTLLLYVLLEMRRKQRPIPVMTKPKNDSLDFVKTIGRLYYDKGDHKNLCRKMAAYFLEHVRSKYKLPTGTLNDEFVKNLQFKTGVDETEVGRIVSFITYLDDVPVVSQKQLSDFYKQLESFYKKA